MMANPVVDPACASPEVWVFAALSMWAEIHTELSMLRRMRLAIPGVWRTLLLVNVMTRTAFLLAMEELSRDRDHLILSIAGLEATVVVVEWLLIWAALRRLARVTSQRPVGLGQVFTVSLVGNVVSIACSIVLPTSIFWLLT